MTRLLVGALFVALVISGACSLENKEGPDVTCADLECGRINACQEGIIAQCMDGNSVIFHVCTPSADNICEEDWQLPGQYRCLETETDCEGCRPERIEGCDYFSEATAGGTTLQGSGGSPTGGSSAGGSPDGGSAGSSAGGTGGS